VTLTIERWLPRSPARPRWATASLASEDSSAGQQLVIDQSLRIVALSPALARRFGLGDSDMIGRPLAALLRPIEDEDGQLPLLAALAGRSAFTGQLAVVRQTNEELLIEGSPRLEDDRFLGYSITLQGEPSAPPLGSLPLDDLLKEPLASIIDQAQEIAARSEGPLRSDYAGYGTDIAAAARHLLDLLAAISPDGASGSVSAGEPIDLAELVLDAAGLVQPQAGERSVQLDVGGLSSLRARGQGRAVTQILVNLIGNAVRFSPPGADVSIVLEGGAEAKVTVSDRGPGVAPADRVRIFERFEQAGTKPGGAGLGLAISRRLAREMGGDVELLEGEGGATFRLRLPLA
jgi:signal transduction histidine kinase